MEVSPTSDSGSSNTDGITNVTHPTFFGSSEPFSTIKVIATPVGGGLGVLIAQGTTDSSGRWNVTSFVTLAEGSYVITAGALDFNRHTTAATVVTTVTGVNTLLIDTAGPKVAFAQFDRLGGQILVTYQDNASGVNLVNISDASNYQLYKNRRLFPGTYIVTSLVPTPGASPTDPVTVPVVINNGRALRGGKYVFTIRSGGIRDVAGNALDGEFYGFFPSGNNVVGGDFVARLDAIHRLILPAQTVVGTATPVNPPGTRPVRVIITGPVSPPPPAPGNGFNIRGAAAKAKAHDAALAQVTVPKKKAR